MKHEKTSRRNERLSSLIRSEAATFLEVQGDMPPGTLLTVTRVELSPDSRYADVFVSIFPTDRIGTYLHMFRQWQHAFNMHARQTLRLKNIPAARFKLDDTELKRERIGKLLEEEKK